MVNCISRNVSDIIRINNLKPITISFAESESNFLPNLATRFTIRHYYISYQILTSIQSASFAGEFSDTANIYGPAFDFSLALEYSVFDLISLQAGVGFNTYKNSFTPINSNLRDYPDLLALNRLIENSSRFTENYLLLGPTALFGRFRFNIFF